MSTKTRLRTTIDAEAGMRDIDIRRVLIKKLERQFESQPSLIVEELGFDGHKSRIDVAVLNCALHAYEIKSDRDTLTRLDAQLVNYREQFHFVTVVCARRHLDGVIAACDATIGIVVADLVEDAVILNVIRDAVRQSQESERIARLFWFEEAIATLQRYTTIKGLKRKRVSELRKLLCDHLTIPQLLDSLRERLQERRAQQLADKQVSGDGLSLWL